MWHDDVYRGYSQIGFVFVRCLFHCVCCSRHHIIAIIAVTVTVVIVIVIAIIVIAIIIAIINFLFYF